MDTAFALDVIAANFTDYRLERGDVQSVNIRSMISPAAGLTMVGSVVFSGFH